VPILTAAGETIPLPPWLSCLLEYYAGYTGVMYHSHWKKNTLEDQLTRWPRRSNAQYDTGVRPRQLKPEKVLHRLEVSRPASPDEGAHAGRLFLLLDKPPPRTYASWVY